MVHIDELMIEEELDDFYRDRDRFKGYKLLIDFEQIKLKFTLNDFTVGKPKMKKKQMAAKYIKPRRDKGSLF